MKAPLFKALLIVGLLPAIAAAQLKLNGAGATFPYVIYSKWFDVYNKKSGVQFNYQSIGSGGGIKQVIEGTVDFGATDGPMNDTQLAEAKQKRGTDILHIPTVMGAVVATYNLPEFGQGLLLTPDVLAGIFLGDVTMWDDAKISAINPGKKLPDRPIVVVHRSDGSGTTYIFVEYLTKVSETWEKKVGKGTSVSWPVGLGGKGNEGVAGLVKQTDGAIGYVELAYAVQNKLPYASIRNTAGKFVQPSLASVSAAAKNEAGSMPADFRVSITNASGDDSYPISGFTWLLVYADMKSEPKANAIVDFLKWALTDGELYAPELLYAPLPENVSQKALATVKSITANGKAVGKK
ncbi:MAG: phosphate ABC transporter substrate-binding protein PstS [Ignavibacteria bacterium GWC2_56_12]|nr:MAG: phosphate ABC transporter substrate-binding protein PstS [Ignavibacteria bacterium GWC2_56_12]